LSRRLKKLNKKMSAKIKDILASIHGCEIDFTDRTDYGDFSTLKLL
jgi:hypothetical protein